MTDNSARRRRPALPTRRTVLSWSLLAACTLTGGGLGAGYGVHRGPVYTATSYVVVVPTDQSDAAPALGFAQAYGRAATQLAVLLDAQAWAGVPVRMVLRPMRFSAARRTFIRRVNSMP